ncbi:hypothetical protein GCM10027599_27160 [Yimella radicis]
MGIVENEVFHNGRPGGVLDEGLAVQFAAVLTVPAQTDGVAHE